LIVTSLALWSASQFLPASVMAKAQLDEAAAPIGEQAGRLRDVLERARREIEDL